LHRPVSYNDEKEFEGYIRGLISKHISSKDNNIFAFTNKKAVDIVVCNNNDPGHLFFMEVKFYKPAHGRLGFGSSKGRGYQPEILQTQSRFLERHMRWVIARENDEKIYLVRNSTLLKYIAGGQLGEKHNNIQTRLFSEQRGLSEKQFIVRLRRWFTETT